MTSDAYGWSLNPSGLKALSPSSASVCDDGNACSYNDRCVTQTSYALPANVTRNVCAGTNYSCPLRDLDSNLFNCYISSSCKGDGTCATTVKQAGILCLNMTDKDPCVPVKYCNGINAQCPPYTRTAPIIAPGSARLMAFPSATVADANALSLSAAISLSFLEMNAVLPVADGGSPYRSLLSIAMNGDWSVACGWLDYAVGYYKLNPTEDPSTCQPSRAIMTASVPVVNVAGQYTNRSGRLMLPLTDSANPVADGTLIKLVYEARNVDGQWVYNCPSTALVIDSSRPQNGSVTHKDPTGRVAGEPMYHSGDGLLFTANGFKDEHPASTWSGLLKYEYTVAAYPLNASLPSYWALSNTLIGLSQSVSTPGQLADATSYVAFMRGYNRAGLASLWGASNPVVIDRTPPLVGFNKSVLDGTVPDDELSPLFLNWTGVFYDPESGVDRYEIGWGTVKGSDDSVAFFSVPKSVTTYIYPFANRWVSGVTYFGTVRAYSGAGLFAARSAPGASSDHGIATTLAKTSRCLP